MNAPDLQYMFSAPRDKTAGDPRVAANFHANKDIGEDGKLYMLVSEEDRSKFKVLDDSQLSQEEKRNEELELTLRASLTSSSGKLDSHGFPRRQHTPSKSPSHPPQRNHVSSPSYSTSLPPKYKASSPSSAKDNEAFNQATEDLHMTIGGDTQTSADSSSEAKLLAAINALQKKYLDNLGVVETISMEKKQVEERLKSVESQLKQSRRSNELHLKLKEYHPAGNHSRKKLEIITLYEINCYSMCRVIVRSECYDRDLCSPPQSQQDRPLLCHGVLPRRWRRVLA
jgi:hypothetical protein